MSIVNNIVISDEKLEHLSEVLPKSTLFKEYMDYTDREIGDKYGLTDRIVCKLRKIYGINTHKRYGLRRNPLRNNSLTSYQKEVLHGTLFGDSLIAIQDSGTGYWKCIHCTAQEKYLLKKAEIFKPFTVKVFHGKRPFEKGGKEFPYVGARTYSLPQFTEYRAKFYPNGKKVITLDILKELTSIGFAYWWMDDGIKTMHGFNIVTYDDVFRSQRALATSIFKTVLNLDVSITWDGPEGNICILKTSHDTAWNYIKPEITEDMVYKLPKKYNVNYAII